jgi:hypothetical protein
MIKSRIDKSFDYKKAIEKGATAGIIGCSDCASVYQAGDTKTIERVSEELSGHCKIIFKASIDSPCDQRILRYISKTVDGFLGPEYYIVLTCVAGVQSIANFITASRPRESFRIISPVVTEDFSIISSGGTSYKACIFCSECVFDERSVFCPVANCPINKKDGPCQTRVSDKCVVSESRICSWIY